MCFSWLTKTSDSDTAFCNPYASHIQTAIRYATLATITFILHSVITARWDGTLIQSFLHCVPVASTDLRLTRPLRRCPCWYRRWSPSWHHSCRFIFIGDIDNQWCVLNRSVRYTGHHCRLNIVNILYAFLSLNYILPGYAKEASISANISIIPLLLPYYPIV